MQINNISPRSHRSPIIVICLLCSLFLVGCHNDTEWRYTGGAAWGTSFNISYRADRDLSDSVTAVMRRVELALSAFDSTSNVSRLNRHLTDTLSAMTYEVFREAQRVSALSGGAFDPTIAPLVNLWGFGYDESADSISPQMLADALARVGIADCHVDSLSRCVTRKHPLTEFDFSAIAKGYGVDCVADMLLRNDCTDFMVEIGGEMRLSGLNPRGELWRVQIDSPLSESSEHRSMRVLELSDCAIATSGNYRNWRRLEDGSIVAHLISPVTGNPAMSSTLSATIIAPRCVTADALATAAMLLAPDSVALILKSEPDTRAILAIAPNAKSSAKSSADSITIVELP